MGWATAGVLLLALLVYRPLIDAGFVYEDHTWQQATSQPASTWRPMRPLMHLSWWVQARYTPSPRAFHVANIALHLLLALLVGVLASRLRVSPLAAWLAGSMVLLHPLTVESVAYLSARTELFAAIGVVAACVLAVTAHGWRWLLVYGALVFGMAGKETAAMGLLLVPLTRWVVGQRWEIPLGVNVALLATAIADRGWLTLVNLGEAGGMRIEWLPWLLIQSTAVVRLTALSLVPWFGGFTVDYDYDLIPQAFRLVALLTLCGLPVLAWRLRKSQPMLAFGLAWMLIAVGPRLLIQTPRSYFNEHQFSVGFIGFAIAGASLTGQAEPRR